MRIMAITGGKGGVGKTTISVSTAVMLAKMKKKVLLFDADLGLANIDVILGLKPKKTIYDCLYHDADLDDVCIEGPCGIKIIPASSGVEEMADISSQQTFSLINKFSTFSEKFDIMIVDLASGISNQVIRFTDATQDIVLVVCDDPASLSDSYAVVKILNVKYGRNRFGLIINKVASREEGVSIFDSFYSVTSKFLNVNMNYLGFIPQDDFIKIASQEKSAVVDAFPTCQASLAFKGVCQNILHWQNEENTLSGGIQFFFERLVSENAMQHPASMREIL